MITDAYLNLSNAQAVTATAVSTNTIDLSANRDIGEGHGLYAVFQVGTAFAGGTSTAFQLVIADDAALTSGVVELAETGPIATASLVSGAQYVVDLPPQIGSTGKRYFGAKYTVVGTNTTGTVTTNIVTDIQDGKKFYPSGFSVK